MDTNTELERLQGAASHFWSKVEQGSVDECWLWTAGKNDKGYGSITLNGKPYRAHRLAWILANEQIIPANMVICHHCDNPPCCNPLHLFLGTPRDNTMDAIRKGRHYIRPGVIACSIGENNHFSKLTADQVREIRQRYHTGRVTCAVLAVEYGVHRATIRNVIRRKSWKDV